MPDISVVIPTYNRGRLLPPLLAALLAQEADGLDYEVIVVDNNSRDESRALIQDAISRDNTGRLHYLFEPRQGVSYARNTGVEHSRGPIVAFLDDDGIPVKGWLRAMKDAFDRYPEADCIGGRVRPNWVTPRPAWLTAAHAGPVALQDRPQPQRVNRSSASACLITANLGVRRAVFAAIGGFSPEYPRNQDREFELRMWRAGMQGLYLPEMDVVVDVPPERLTRRYHRRWQATTGKYHALLRFRDTVDADGVLRDENPHARKLLGVPLFLYRAFLAHVRGWFLGLLRFDDAARFYHETRLWYHVSFFWTRFKTDVIGSRFRRRPDPVES